MTKHFICPLCKRGNGQRGTPAWVYTATGSVVNRRTGDLLTTYHVANMDCNQDDMSHMLRSYRASLINRDICADCATHVMHHGSTLSLYAQSTRATIQFYRHLIYPVTIPAPLATTTWNVAQSIARCTKMRNLERFQTFYMNTNPIVRTSTGRWVQVVNVMHEQFNHGTSVNNLLTWVSENQQELLTLSPSLHPASIVPVVVVEHYMPLSGISSVLTQAYLPAPVARAWFAHPGI